MKFESFASHADAFRSGTTSPIELLEESLRLIDEREERLSAFVQIARDTARRDAEESALRWRRAVPLSPIDGILVGVKDIIETVDMPTGQGSPLWTGFRSLRDAATVQALREAGAIILGKTTTTEFAATELLARTVNPHDFGRTAGGSSSGSAAAVGAGFIPIALGSQVVGSTLRPSSYCGCIGFKPTTGGLNRGGSYDYLSQSCVGLIGRALEDVWLSAKAIATRVGGDPGSPGLQGPDQWPEAKVPRRLIMLETAGWERVTPGAKEAIEGELHRLRLRGIEVVGRRQSETLDALERAIKDALDVTLKISGWEFRWPMGTYAQRDANGISKPMLRRHREAEQMTQADYAAALAKRSSVRAAFQDLLAPFDGVVTLAATGAAPVGFSSTGDPSFNVPASLLGVPAISLPVLSDDGLPLGLQLMTAAGRDTELFAFARWALEDR